MNEIQHSISEIKLKQDLYKVMMIFGSNLSELWVGKLKFDSHWHCFNLRQLGDIISPEFGLIEN